MTVVRICYDEHVTTALLTLELSCLLSHSVRDIHPGFDHTQRTQSKNTNRFYFLRFDCCVVAFVA